MALARRLTGASLGVAMACVFLILAFTILEVVVRAFGRPTTWVLDTTSYLMCVMVGAAFPAITLRNGNVAVTLLTEMVRPPYRAQVYRAIDAACGLACLVAGAVCAMVLERQYMQGITTLTGVIIPKWVLTAVLLYGFWSSGVIHGLHAAFGRRGAGNPAMPV